MYEKEPHALNFANVPNCSPYVPVHFVEEVLMYTNASKTRVLLLCNWAFCVIHLMVGNAVDALSVAASSSLQRLVIVLTSK